jgi:hypothetical protein
MRHAFGWRQQKQRKAKKHRRYSGICPTAQPLLAIKMSNP